MESSRALFCRSSPLIAENTPQTRGGSCLLFILCLLWLAPEHIHMHFTFTRMMFRSCVEHGTSRWSKGALFAAARAHVSCMEALWPAHNQRNCAENLIRRYFYCSLRAAASRLVSWNSIILMIQHTFTFSILIKTWYANCAPRVWIFRIRPSLLLANQRPERRFCVRLCVTYWRVATPLCAHHIATHVSY